MLFSTSLVALILTPRRLQITNTKVGRKVAHSSETPTSFAKGALRHPLATSRLYFRALTLFLAEKINHMRAHIPDHGSGCTHESQAAGGRLGGSDIPLRH